MTAGMGAMGWVCSVMERTGRSATTTGPAAHVDFDDTKGTGSRMRKEPIGQSDHPGQFRDGSLRDCANAEAALKKALARLQAGGRLPWSWMDVRPYQKVKTDPGSDNREIVRWWQKAV